MGLNLGPTATHLSSFEQVMVRYIPSTKFEDKPLLTVFYYPAQIIKKCLIVKFTVYLGCSSLPVVLIVLPSGCLPDVVVIYPLCLRADAVLNGILGFLPVHIDLEIQIYV